ncbi:malate dehydrogenase [Methanobrevibacter gottschalkii]|uniref:Malate dehydrogenase n=2 Tax=Methanobrevibacter gottschalkii TaxID=190974 RepID=A0A3N5BMQ7_9EURY|nr:MULTISPECIES: malate dehydrogenase [Methanobrevibacter]MCQ2970558.1 malate dehydrogenase [archaeon]OED01702.1 malate dehydrogenase [Methanobrevibacter sp. A27]RPF50978.1 malate dehydrogenase [Methanobrevibacter gottschalkii DSM 11977]SEL08606.1 malate dehydrogenase [Methanobrevibacter gottschalkii]
MVKVSIFGSTGTIGKNVAFTLARMDTVDEIVMVSRPKSLDKVKGETYDMYDALAARDIDCKLIPTCDFNEIRGSEIVLIAAGIHRQPGMNRLELAIPNAKIVRYYSKQIAKYAPDSIILVATNPVDVMTTIALEASGFNKMKVIGVGNHLDSLRLKNYFSRKININSSEVHTRVVGEHGNHMVPLLSSTSIGGIPLKYFEFAKLDVDALVEQLKNAGNTIISKKGATEYGPAFAISNLISTMITDSHKVLTVSFYLEGEVEGVRNVSLGVPAITSKNGIEMIVPIHMNDVEKESFIEAANVVRDTTYKVKENLNI